MPRKAKSKVVSLPPAAPRRIQPPTASSEEERAKRSEELRNRDLVRILNFSTSCIMHVKEVDHKAALYESASRLYAPISAEVSEHLAATARTLREVDAAQLRIPNLVSTLIKPRPGA